MEIHDSVIVLQSFETDSEGSLQEDENQENAKAKDVHKQIVFNRLQPEAWQPQKMPVLRFSCLWQLISSLNS